MWRSEVGCFEMLTAYFDQHEEQMRPGRSRRDFLLEILHTHEMSILGLREDDVIMLPYNEQSQSFYVFDRSISKTLQIQNLNEPPPLVRPRNCWPYREPLRSFRPQGLAPNSGQKGPMSSEGRLPVDMDEDVTVTAVCHGEMAALTAPPRVERLPTPPAAADDVTALPAAAFAPLEASAAVNGPAPTSAASDYLRLPTASPTRESGGPVEAPARRRPYKKRRFPQMIRRLRSTLPMFEGTDRSLDVNGEAAELQPAERPRRQLHAVNYRTVRKRRARQKREAGQDRVEPPPRENGGPPVGAKKRGRRPRKHWRKRRQAAVARAPSQPSAAAPKSPQPPSFVLLPKDEVVDVELEEVQVSPAQPPDESTTLDLTPGSVRKSSRLVGHQNPILERMKRKEYRRRRAEGSDLSEFSDEATSPPPPPPPAAPASAPVLYPCSMCPRKFKYKNSRVSHMRRHTNLMEKKFECGICQKRFTTKAYCKNHERRHSEGPPAKSCRFCGAQFESKADRQEHEMRAHIAAM